MSPDRRRQAPLGHGAGLPESSCCETSIFLTVRGRRSGCQENGTQWLRQRTGRRRMYVQIDRFGPILMQSCSALWQVGCCFHSQRFWAMRHLLSAVTRTALALTIPAWLIASAAAAQEAKAAPGSGGGSKGGGAPAPSAPSAPSGGGGSASGGSSSGGGTHSGGYAGGGGNTRGGDEGGARRGGGATGSGGYSM